MARRPKARSLSVETAAPSPPARKSDRRRQRLIDATLECFVEDGWARTNMSLIARRAGVTRGMMQYYFPTLEDALKASVDHLNETWRRRYFEAVDSRRRMSSEGYFEFGIDQLWQRVQEPLHVAKQELEAAARTDPELRVVMEASARTDEATTLEVATRTYPELAAADPDAFRLTRDFTIVFLEGLSLFPFASDAEARRERLIELLKLFLAQYWRSHGAGDGLLAPDKAAAVAAQIGGTARDEAAVSEAMALLARAQAVLEGTGAKSPAEALEPAKAGRRGKPKD